MVYWNSKIFHQKIFYDLASLTKVIGTTSRILQLIDDERISFSSIVGEILPDYRHIPCTIAELLLHSSGLPADLVNKKNLTKTKMKEMILHSSFCRAWKEVLLRSRIHFVRRNNQKK